MYGGSIVISQTLRARFVREPEEEDLVLIPEEELEGKTPGEVAYLVKMLYQHLGITNTQFEIWCKMLPLLRYYDHCGTCRDRLYYDRGNKIWRYGRLLDDDGGPAVDIYDHNDYRTAFWGEDLSIIVLVDKRSYDAVDRFEILAGYYNYVSRVRIRALDRGLRYMILQ